MTEHTLYLKKNKGGLRHSRHPWIFDGALDSRRNGELPAGTARLVTADGQFVAVGSYNPKSAIAFRVFSFADRPLDTAFWTERFVAAERLRRAVVDEQTDGFRMLNSEGDGVPGLTADMYAGHCVVQVGTPTMDRLTPVWLEAMRAVFDPKSIVRKDSQSVANREHMTAVSEVLFGSPPDTVRFFESGIPFETALLPGQKTGFFFDQRVNRIDTAALCAGRRVLDGYAYTGGFGAHALAAGAAYTVGVDSSQPACALMARNYRANGSPEKFEVIQGDCVRFLKETTAQYDVVVLDPPALAKRRHHLPKAGKVYRDIFASGMSRISSEGGILCACTCSSAVDTAVLLDILRAAKSASGRSAQVLKIGGAGADHPVALDHPEGEYLKSALLRIL